VPRNLEETFSHYPVYIFDNMALYFECRINKNVPLQTVFWRFYPLGIDYIFSSYDIEHVLVVIQTLDHKPF